ncbi:MAG: protein YgfX [Pseudomonadota bacterium]
MRKDAPLLLLRPAPSKIMIFCMGLMHVLALMAVWCADLTWSQAALVALAVLAHGWRWCRARPRVSELQWGAGDVWRLSGADGPVWRARLDVGASRSWAGWVFLSFRLEGGGRLRVLLPRDSLSEDDFRRLRVRLRLTAGQVAGREAERGSD